MRPKNRLRPPLFAMSKKSTTSAHRAVSLWTAVVKNLFLRFGFPTRNKIWNKNSARHSPPKLDIDKWGGTLRGKEFPNWGLLMDPVSERVSMEFLKKSFQWNIKVWRVITDVPHLWTYGFVKCFFHGDFQNPHHLHRPSKRLFSTWPLWDPTCCHFCCRLQGLANQLKTWCLERVGFMSLTSSVLWSRVEGPKVAVGRPSLLDLDLPTHEALHRFL